MTVKKLSIQRKRKCHIAGDSALGLRFLKYPTFCGPVPYFLNSVISSNRRKKLFILLCTSFKILVPLNVWRGGGCIVEISFLDELAQPERQV